MQFEIVLSPESLFQSLLVAGVIFLILPELFAAARDALGK